MQHAMKELLESIPVPPKMVRHFAVVTVCITVFIAIFADSERREAISDEMHVEQQRAALREAEVKKMGARKLALAQTSRPASASGGFGGEGPVDPGGSGGGSGSGSGPETRPPVQGTPYRIDPHAPSTLPPGFVPGSGKLPGSKVGTASKAPPRQPSAAELDKQRRAAEARAGAATQPQE